VGARYPEKLVSSLIAALVRSWTGFLANRRGTGANRGRTRRAHFYAIVGGPMVKDAA
jgi:hypothetical protein